MFVASAVLRPSCIGPRLAGRVGAARSVYCRASAQIDSTPQAVSGSGKPVNFSWTLASSKGLSQDASRYESELRNLFESEDDDWAFLPMAQGKLMFREVTGVDNPAPVSKYIVNLDYAHGANSLFKFLTSLEGFALIDPASDLASTRTNPCHRFMHRGLEGYSCAPVTEFAKMGGLKMACPNAVWFDDEIFLNWPCVIPANIRPAACAEVKRDYLMVYSFRVRDVDPRTVQFQQLMWLDILRGERGEQGHKSHAESFHSRLVGRLASAEELAAA